MLPGIDDGSKSYEETEKICKMLKEQGVNSIIATPHFYADSNDPVAFLLKRDKAFETIKTLAKEYNIRKGAEVRYFSGIGRSEDIEKLTLEDSGFMLLELTEKRINDFVINDIMQLKSRNIRPIIAHLNRHREFRDEGFIEFCNINNIPIQINTECLFNRWTRKRALDLIATGRVQFLATDCHDCEKRKPDMGEAVDILRRYLGDEYTEDFIGNEEIIINE